MTETIYSGIDVSNWQGTIDFNKVKNDGIWVVYMRASEGTSYTDARFEENYRNAKAAGLFVGAYHYMTASNAALARRQAEFFSKKLAGKSMDCPPAMDYENLDALTDTQIHESGLAFLERLQSLTGVTPVIYTNLSNARRLSSRFSKYPLWQAQYGVLLPHAVMLQKDDLLSVGGALHGVPVLLLGVGQRKIGVARGGVPVICMQAVLFYRLFKSFAEPEGAARESVEGRFVLWECLADGGTAVFDVAKECARGCVDLAVLVRIGVDADRVSFGGNAPHDLFAPLDLPPDEEKGRFYTLFLQDVQYERRHRIGGPVVKGKKDLPLFMRLRFRE